MATDYCLTIISKDCRAEVLQSKAFAMFFSLPKNSIFESKNSFSSVSGSVNLFEIIFSSPLSLGELVGHCASFFKNCNIDYCVQGLPIIEKKLFISDMDSTILSGECLDELGFYLGLGDKMSSITQRAMRGEIDFVQALIERVAMLEGMPIESMKQVRKNIKIRPGASKLLKYLKKNGIYTCLISGGFDFFTEYFASSLGFDSFFANKLETDNEKLTGKLISPIVDGRFKYNKLISLSSKKNFDLSQTIAMGDGANDLEMLSKSGLSISIRGKPLLSKICCFQLNHCDLDIICEILEAHKRHR